MNTNLLDHNAKVLRFHAAVQTMKEAASPAQLREVAEVFHSLIGEVNEAEDYYRQCMRQSNDLLFQEAVLDAKHGDYSSAARKFDSLGDFRNAKVMAEQSRRLDRVKRRGKHRIWIALLLLLAILAAGVGGFYLYREIRASLAEKRAFNALGRVLLEMPDLTENPLARPIPAQMPKLVEAVSSIRSEAIKSAAEEYAVGAVLVTRGYESMLKAKEVLGIVRLLRIEEACVMPCECKGAADAALRKCLSCHGTGQCPGRCSTQQPSGLGNGTYKNYFAPNGTQMKKRVRHGANDPDCARTYDGACHEYLHHDKNGFYYLTKCDKCNGTARCTTCRGSGKVAAASATCPKCNGSGFVVDAKRARKMLGQCDKWLRDKARAADGSSEKPPVAEEPVENDNGQTSI